MSPRDSSAHPRKSTAHESRENAIHSVVPNDEFADQVVSVGMTVFKLHSAITGTQSQYFRRNREAIRIKNRLGQPFPIEGVWYGTFKRVLRWLYFGEGAKASDDLNTLGFLFEIAMFLEIKALSTQVLALVESPEYSKEFPGEDELSALIFLDQLYIYKDKYQQHGKVLERLCTRLITSVSAESLVDFYRGPKISFNFQLSLRKQLRAGKFVANPPTTVADPPNPGSIHVVIEMGNSGVMQEELGGDCCRDSMYCNCNCSEC
ncbi:hypothetical protein TWF481_003148 [Arthrobotrys musiformis]|uniref:BTB domain-containing protein n=1 Tax=Arthrobotrys musiformis TaxID=47236 RepID=A0AAV9VPG0_9PEZI